MDYILYGAGGHAKVVIDNIIAQGDRVIGFVDDNVNETEWNGVNVLGSINQITDIREKYPLAMFIVTIGNNYTRMKKARLLQKMGCVFGKAIHPSSVIGSNVLIGSGTVIMPNAVINADTILEDHVIVNTAATIDHECRIGEFAHISPGVNMAGGVSIGCCSHIGIGASLIPQVVVGNDTIVGAGSCVIRDLPNHTVAVGIPAKVIKKL